MSVRVMAWVWEQSFNHSEQAIMLALADHANDAGGSIYPSVARVAWKTGYSERQVQRIMANLREKGILEIVAEASGHRPTEYQIVFDASKAKRPFRVTECRDDNSSPQEATECHPRGDIATSGRGDITVSPKPSRTITKPSSGEAIASPKGKGLPPPVKALLAHFKKRTGASLVPSMPYTRKRALWYRPLRQMVELAGGDAELAKRTLDEALKRLEPGDYLVGNPNAALKTYSGVIAKHNKQTITTEAEDDMASRRNAAAYADLLGGAT